LNPLSKTAARHAEKAPGADAHEPPAHAFMFWLLLALAASAFLPAALSPIWQDRLAWKQKEEAAGARVLALRQRYERNQATIEALGSDPAANERLAIRELGYVRPGEKLVSLAGWERPGLPASARPPDSLEPSSQEMGRPHWLDRLAERLPRTWHNPAFAANPTRELLLVMSGTLTLAAFWLFRRR